MTTHKIAFYSATPYAGRTSWDCSCGASGSAPDVRAEEAAEKHLLPGEPVTYRFPPR